MADLISLTEYKQFKEISSTDHDVQHQAYITAVSEFVKSYCSRSFIDRYFIAKTEYIDGTINNLVLPKEFPLAEVVSVEASLDGGQTYTTLTEFTDYIVDEENSTISSVESFFITDRNAIRSPKSLKIVYKGGYSATPQDIKLAVLDLVSNMSQNRLGSATKNLKGATLQQLSYRSLPEHIKTILSAYRVML